MAVVACLGPAPGAGAQLAPDLIPERRVASANELAQVLRSDFRGRVVVPANANWEMRETCGGRDEFGNCTHPPLTYLPVKPGVSLVGERGPLGSRPVLYATYDREGYPLFHVLDADRNAPGDVRIEGLELRGPRRVADRFKQLTNVTAIRIDKDPKQHRGRRIAIADNALHHWTVGVNIGGTHQVDRPQDFCAPPPPGDGPCRRPSYIEAPLYRVERNYMHDNVAKGGGYGVVIDGGAFATVEGNVFEYNNHSIAASGQAFSGYVARFNYVLRGVHTFGEDRTYPHSLDVHGRGNVGDKEYAGGPAGTYFDVSFNTVLGEQDYGFLGRLTRAAFALRGKPTRPSYFRGNVLAHDDFDEAVKLRAGDDDRLDEDEPETFNLRAGPNYYDRDYSREIAAGDFDGDRRTDVFVANGTAWFVSWGGLAPWTLLHISNKRTHELGFADVDNDRRTDVLYRDGSGRVGFLRGGAGNLVPLTTGVPVAMKDVRFGDFDGDGLTDMFFTRDRQWRVWYGRTRAWTPTQSSGRRIDELLFGEFDDVRGTDVATVNGRGWDYSSGSTTGWTPLNGRLTSSFAGAVAGDFDGNGRTDVAVGDSRRWRFSRDGRGPLETLREGNRGPGLGQALVGNFDGARRNTLVGFSGDRLVIWRGPPTRDWQGLSPQNMR